MSSDEQGRAPPKGTNGVPDLPEPMTPADCDLTSFAFMPLDVQALRDSDFAASASSDAFRAAVLLWCASWHQRPAGSIPDDDRVLAQLTGYGRAVREWQRLRDEALHGFVRCSDGRLYHPKVCEKALASWERKKAQRDRTAKAREAALQRKGAVTGDEGRQSQAQSQNTSAPVTERVTAQKSAPSESESESEQRGRVANAAAARACEVDALLERVKALDGVRPGFPGRTARARLEKFVDGGLDPWRHILPAIEIVRDDLKDTSDQLQSLAHPRIAELAQELADIESQESPNGTARTINGQRRRARNGVATNDGGGGGLAEALLAEVRLGHRPVGPDKT